MDLKELRAQIDEIDDKLVALFCQRMEVSARISDYKKENGLPIHVPAREREKLADVAEKAGPQMANYTRVLYSMLFELSRSYQSRRSAQNTQLFQSITHAIEHTPELFPQQAMVACPGIEGVYAQTACEKFFKDPCVMYFKNLDGVFNAIEQGLCRYGILPLENASAGSSNKIYDRILQHRFSIVRSFRMKNEYDLLALPGAQLGNIRRIYSHQQAISQCSSFLNTMPGAKIIPVENIAAAAQMVAESGSPDVAALSNRACQELYGLTCLAGNVQDKGSSPIRYLCVSKELEIYPGADKTSIMMVLANKTGALYKVMARLYNLGIHVTKLESSPIPDQDHQVMFYFDLDTSIYSEEFAHLMCELEDLCEEFRYLGSYCEVV